METQTLTPIVKINPAEFGLEETKAAQIEAQFKPMLEKMTELEKEYNEIIALPTEDTSAAERAKALRLKYVKVRTGTAEIHKTQKAFFLAGGRFVDGWKNAQLFATQGIEEKLSAIENLAENKEKERIATLQKEREEAVKAYGVENAEALSLGLMSEQVWTNFLSGSKSAFDTKVAAEEKAKADAIEADRLAKLHSKRKEDILDLWSFAEVDVKESNLGLLSEDAWRMTVASLEQKKTDSILAAQAKEAELAKAKADKDKADAEAKEAAAAAAKAKVEADAAIKAEKDKADALAAELKAKADAEAKEAADKIAADKKAKAAPDKVKLKELAKQISSIEFPDLASEEAKAITDEADKLLVKVANYILAKAEKL